MFDIKKLLNCTPLEFEELCCAYAQAKYGDRARVNLTPAQGDGGKDIEIILIPTNIINWGECKIHNRNIDLSSIAKNVVLVQSRKICKIIFFSTTDIVYNTKKHIFEVARAHGFEVVFLDRENLFSEFAKFKIIQDYDLDNSLFKIDIFAQEFTQNENAFNYIQLSKNPVFTLKSSNRFSFLLLLKNRSFIPFKAKIAIDNADKRFKIKILQNKIELAPYSDTLTEICVEANIKYGESIKLPAIKINVSGNQETYDCGELKADFYPEVPFIGQNNIDSVQAIQNGFVNDSFNVAEIIGKKGTGKSRAIKEITQRFKEAKIFQFCAQNGDTSPILALISFIIDLTLNGNGKMNDEVFKALLRSKNFDENTVSSFSKYYASSDTLSANEINELFNIIIRQLIKKSKKELVLIVFDEINELDINSVRLLSDLINTVSDKKCGIKIIVALNKVKEDNRSNELKILENTLTNLTNEKKCFAYKCEELDDEDKLLYCLEILGKNEDRCAKIIVSKYPGSPGTLSDVCNGLLPLERDERIAKLNKSTDLDKIHNELIANLFIGKDGDYGKYVETFCKWLILFQNRVPAKFINEYMNADYLQKMKKERLIKYNLDTDTYRFYQEYSLSVLKSHFNDLKPEAEIVLQWLDKSNTENVLVRFICYTVSKRLDEAFKYGFLVLQNEKTDVRIRKRIAETLYYAHANFKDKQAHYKIVKSLAHIYLFNNNFKEGVKFFKKAYNLSLNKCIKLEKTETYHIRHEYINSLIHCGRYSDALSTLNSIQESSIESLKHRFLLHNRFGVTNTFLYNTADAENNLQTAMKLALEMNDKFFVSTNYSDLAYLYLKTNQKEKAALYFNKAVAEHKACGYSELYRDIEIYEQKAIALALKNKYNKAMSCINRAQDICKRNYRSFSLLKVNFVKAFINVCLGNFETTETIYNECITLAKIFGSDIQLIYANAGLAALYMLQNKGKQVTKIFHKLMCMFEKFEGTGAKLSILKNFALWFYSKDEAENLNELRSLNFAQLNDYIEKIINCNDMSKSFDSKLAQNAANYDGISFLY